MVSLLAAGAAGVPGAREALAGEPPPELTTLRLRRDSPGTGFICYAPEYVAEELLRAEGFTDIQYIFVPAGERTAEAFARGELDFGLFIAMSAAIRLDAGVPITMLAGIHTGCFEDTSKNRAWSDREDRISVRMAPGRMGGAGSVCGGRAGPALTPPALRPGRLGSRTRPGGACW